MPAQVQLARGAAAPPRHEVAAFGGGRADPERGHRRLRRRAPGQGDVAGAPGDGHRLDGARERKKEESRGRCGTSWVAV